LQSRAACALGGPLGCGVKSSASEVDRDVSGWQPQVNGKLGAHGDFIYALQFQELQLQQPFINSTAQLVLQDLLSGRSYYDVYTKIPASFETSIKASFTMSPPATTRSFATKLHINTDAPAETPIDTADSINWASS
jgi:hypothetical protein